MPFHLSTFDAEVYEELQEEAKWIAQRLLKERAEKSGVQNVVTVVEMGNPKVLCDIPSMGLTLLWSGANGLNAFERLMVGSSSEYILCRAKVDLLVVRDKDKTM